MNQLDPILLYSDYLNVHARLSVAGLSSGSINKCFGLGSKRRVQWSFTNQDQQHRSPN